MSDETMADLVAENQRLRAEVALLRAKLERRKPVRRAPASSTPISDDLRAEIAAYAAEHRTATQSAIAARFGVNQGRVSEALAGRRQ